MGLNAKNLPSGGGAKSEPLEAGNYPCRVAHVIDLGLQAQRPWKGEEKKPAHTIMVTYEFTDEFQADEDGNELPDKPRHLSEEFPFYSLKSERATSTKRYMALDPAMACDGEWPSLIGTPCMVTVTATEGKGSHAGRVFNNVSGVSAMRPKDVEKTPELVNPGKVFLLDEPDLEVFLSLPEWIQEKVKGNLEFNGSKLQQALSGAAPSKNEPAAEPKNEPALEVAEDDIPW